MKLHEPLLKRLKIKVFCAKYIRKYRETNYVAAKMILAKNRDKLDRLADALMEKTTLIHTDIQRIVNS